MLSEMDDENISLLNENNFSRQVASLDINLIAITYREGERKRYIIKME